MTSIYLVLTQFSVFLPLASRLEVWLVMAHRQFNNTLKVSSFKLFYNRLLKKMQQVIAWGTVR